MSAKTRKPVGRRLRAKKKKHAASLKARFQRESIWHKLALIVVCVVFFFVSVMYGISQWYIAKHRNDPLQIGMTFVPSYARYYGLDPKETMQAIIDDLGIKRLRLVSYWDKGEPTPGTYNFNDLDWQMKLAEANDVKVSLAIGLRQPRWPECHLPKWAAGQSVDEWAPQLNKYIEAVVNRYKDSSALQSYQLENEYFLDVFGECTDFSRDRLISEYNLVKSLDPHRPLIVSMSNNAIGTPIGEPTPDMWAISVYKRVWDKTITKRYFEYPIPAWYYGFRAGWVELTRGKNSFIHELQTEAWLPDNGNFKMNSVSSIDEQNKSLNPERLKDRIEYGRATGMRTFDLWGGEWWYWRKVKAGDPSLWNTAKDEITRIQLEDSLRGR
jgi:hypothetical protein